jgi:FkbM family methyltransferase
MRLERLYNERTIAPDLLMPGGWVLDAGCLGFRFARRMAERGLKILALDPSKKIKDPEIDGIVFRPWALIAQASGCAWYSQFDKPGQPSSPSNCAGSEKKTHSSYTVPARNLQQLMAEFGIDRFEIVKMNIEGAEYEIMKRWPGPVTKQIDVSFHDFKKINPCEPDRERYYREMFPHIKKWYAVVRHKLDDPFKAGLNYWDSLFILRELLG